MLISRLGAILRRLIGFRRLWHGGEQEISFNRLIFLLTGIGYIAAVPSLHSRDMLHAVTLYLFATVAFIVAQIRNPAQSSPRIILGIIADVAIISCCLRIGGQAMTVLYSVLLWLILGNGFRFGVRFLLAAMVIAIIGFVTVVSTTAFWRSQPALSFGLGSGLVILPLYATTLVRKLSQAKEAAEDASRAKTRFLASVSHELRTPLNAIIGFSRLLGETRLDGEQTGMVRSITSAGRTLLDMISNILDFSRLEAGKMPRQAEDFCLRALLREVYDMLSTEAGAKGLRLGVHIAARTPMRFFHAERGHLQEILLNLAANAVKFTARGEVVIAADVAMRADARYWLRCEVSDTGIGIAPEAKERIFEQFTQADASVLNRFGGTGLGLAICKKLAELMEGTIGVESEPGRGSVFWFEIPIALAETSDEAERERGASPIPRIAMVSRDPMLASRLVPEGEGEVVALFSSIAAAERAIAEEPVPLLLLDERHPDAAREVLVASGALPPLALVADEDAPGLAAPTLRAFAATRLAPNPHALRTALALVAPFSEEAPPAPAIQPSSRPLRILLAEDNRTNQKVVVKILERAGHAVEIAENGEAALDALERENFDLVLMDVNMPVMNGLDAVKLYRLGEFNGKRLPIIALTADATPEAEALCREAGMDACLTKPIEPERLIRAIADLVPDVSSVSGDESVTEITSHPRFRAAGGNVIDAAVLADLEALGGKEFVVELIDSFLADSRDLVAEMAAAASLRNSTEFRSHAHALRSAAANIGAKSLFELCLSWRLIRTQELENETEELIPRLNAELERARGQLLAHRARLMAAAQDG